MNPAQKKKLKELEQDSCKESYFLLLPVVLLLVPCCTQFPVPSVFARQEQQELDAEPRWKRTAQNVGLAHGLAHARPKGITQ